MLRQTQRQVLLGIIADNKGVVDAYATLVWRRFVVQGGPVGEAGKEGIEHRMHSCVHQRQQPFTQQGNALHGHVSGFDAAVTHRAPHAVVHRVVVAVHHVNHPAALERREHGLFGSKYHA